MSDNAVILAAASPPGRSPRGLIRLSGPRTHELLNQRLDAPPDNDRLSPDRSALRLARLRFEKFELPTTALLFRGPRSYTGEDAAELQLPGNPILLERVIDSLLAAAEASNIDARRAEPGEFTARAFLNGKLDLIEAEGVAATIAARSDAELRAARLLTAGGLGSIAAALAEQLAGALALVEAGIDFTDQEDVVAISPRDLAVRLDLLTSSLGDVLNRAVGAEQLEAIPWVVLVGEPNTGKSTLFNALLGRERAVVSPVAGTTRDVIAEPLHIPTPHGEAEVMLVDLAGLAESHHAMNVQMQRAAHEAINRAELILRCVSIDEQLPHRGPLATSPPSNEFLVRTKVDLFLPLPRCEGEGWGEGDDESQCVHVSAATHCGLETLTSHISNHLADRAVSLAADALALWPRHEHALRATQSHLEEAADLIALQRTQRALAQPELIAAAMRAALDELGSLTGRITPDEVLGRIFATFCVGK